LPRTARKPVPGAYYYIVSRPGDGLLLFRDESDCPAFLKILQGVQKRLPSVELCAFCALPDCFAALVFDGSGELGSFMRLLLGRYSRHRSDIYGTGRRLYGGRRFSSLRIRDTDEDLAATLAHISRLPSEGGLVLFPELWRGSSCSSYLGGPVAPVLTGFHRIASILGPDPVSRFRLLLDSPAALPERLATPVSEAAPAEPRMLPADPAGILARELSLRRGDLVRPRGLEMKRIRHKAFEICRSRWGMSFAEIARAFGVTPAAVVQALSTGEKRRRPQRRGAARQRVRSSGAASGGELPLQEDAGCNSG